MCLLFIFHFIMLKGCHCLLSKWKQIKYNLTRDILLLEKYKMEHKKWDKRYSFELLANKSDS